MCKEIKKKCKSCKKYEAYDSDGLCIICNYQKMLGIKSNK